ncbi:MAG TPA: glycosyltransferase [Longimicrobiales bacterium]|nr:glycosyltransferase [Longimicrobiales bacterium]
MSEPTDVNSKAPRTSDHLTESLTRLLDSTPIVCFANDWGGDPTSKHHIMRLYAGFTDVLWVESSGMRVPNLLSKSDLGRIYSKIARSQQGTTRPSGRLRVIAPLTLPFPASRLARRANGLLLERAISRTGFSSPPPILWVYTPTVAPYLDAFPHTSIVYHCVDRWWEFGEFDPALMREFHESLCTRATVTFASSQELLLDCQPHTPRAHLMRHGVDWEHFAAAVHNPPPEPDDISDIEGPILGFFGLIHDWIDQELLVALARAFPESTLVLLGKTRVDVSRLQGVPNIRLLGQKRYEDLPAYAARFDVGLVPFVVNELTLAVNPIKLREYLSAGVPVVSTALPEMLVYGHRDDVRVAGGHAEFIEGVGELLRRTGSADRRQRLAEDMRGESWLGRCESMIRLWHDQRRTSQGATPPSGRTTQTG